MYETALRLRSHGWRRVILGVAVLAFLGTATAAFAQAPPARPRPKPTREESRKPPERPVFREETGPPPPVLIISSDMPCRLEVDGREIGLLEKDVVRRFTVTEGDHLLQAFPLDLEGGPTWKDSIKAPETGQVTATVELVELVEDWHKQQEEQERFDVGERTVRDHSNGLIWMRNVSPRMRWDDARDYCGGRDLDGIRDWRLPVLDELSTLQYDDHESVRQEMASGDVRWTILGRRREGNEVLPRLIHPAFDHNSVEAIWIEGELGRTACTFLGGFGCQILRKKKEQAAVLCVAPLPAPPAAADSEVPDGQ